MNKTLLILLAATSLASMPAFAGSKDNAFNKGGSAIVTKSGDCVLTKWEGGKNCDPAPKPEPVAQPAPPPPQPEIQYEKRVVYFDFGKSVLSGEAVSKLDSLISTMAGYTNITKAEVYGFADVVGSKDANYKLAERRGFAVRDYIASRTNIPVEAMGIKSLGEDSPTAQCDGIKNKAKLVECLAPDRRVEVEFTYEKLK